MPVKIGRDDFHVVRNLPLGLSDQIPFEESDDVEFVPAIFTKQIRPAAKG